MMCGMKRFVAPLIIIVLVIAEFCLALWGPLAFVQKPSLIVGLPYSYGLEDEEVARVFDHIQESFARTRVFRVIPHSLIVDYYVEKQDDPDFRIDDSMSYRDYLDLAAELAIDRVATISIFPGDELGVTIVLRNVAMETTGPRFSYTSPDVEGFLQGVLTPEAALEAAQEADPRARDLSLDTVDTSFNLAPDLREEIRGVTLFDNLVFLLFAGQAILAILLMLRRRVDLFNQVLLIASLVLFLFAFVYAKNASMDYVQRFIANNGQISLAESTAKEQLFALVRFGPLFIVNVFLFIRQRVPSRKRGGGPPVAEMEIAGDLRALIIAGAPGTFASRVRRIARIWALPLAIVSAFVYSIAFPSFISLQGQPWLAWIALIPLFVAVLSSRGLHGVFHVIAFGALTAVVLNYWHGTYSYVSLAFSVIVSAVFYVVFAPIFVLVVKRLGKWGYLAAPALWVTLDFARAAGYIGYPWGYFGVTQYTFVPFIQAADLAGVWAITFVLVLWNAGIAWALTRDDRRRWVPAVVGAGLAVLTLGYGVVRLATLDSAATEAASEQDARNMRVVLVQQNTDPRKHDYRLSFETLQEQTALALEESAPRVPDLVVWPEGGFKPDLRYWLDRPNSRSRSRVLVTEFMEYTASLGTWLVTGSQDHVYLPEGEDGEDIKRNFNSAILMTPGGEIGEIYHKIHLVPFTEHFPYKEEFPWVAAMLDKFDTSNWKQGEERTIFDHPVAPFFTPICFEDIFPNDIRRFVLDGGEIIVNMSNDYWSLTPVEGQQHAAHAMFRAVENRRPMVRSTCSGLTTYITSEGRMAEDPPAYYEPGYLTVDIPLTDRGTTVYTRAGDWLPWMSIAIVALALLFVAAQSVVLIVREVREKRDRGGGCGDTGVPSADA
jgi:apolipoprotein N-acyltransferase